MSSAVAGYKRAFGSDTVPCNYEDIENSDLFIIIGSNMAWCHPILFGRLKSSKQANPNKKIVVIDPRATDNTAIADLHLPIRSGTDTHLFVGLLNYLHQKGYANHDYLRHCDNLADALVASDSWTIKKVAKICGVNESNLTEFYQLFATTKKTVSFYSMGVNQASNGTDKVNSIINCHLYTGKLGYEGAGAFSITGQPNAMGGREVGALANLLASHFELKNSDHRQTVANFWQAPTSISGKDGVKATQCADAILEGKLKRFGLWRPILWSVCQKQTNLPWRYSNAHWSSCLTAQKTATRSTLPMWLCPRKAGVKNQARSPTANAVSLASAA